MKQLNFFGEDFEQKLETNYTSKIKAPIYTPKNKKPDLLEMCDFMKYQRLKNEILNSEISEADKKFLCMAATRHLTFNYEKIADYYAHSDKKIQDLMEKSALIIIDFDKAIQYGYIKLSEEMTQAYLNENQDEK